MNSSQPIVIEIVNSYRIEKIKLCDQHIQKVKDLIDPGYKEAEILAVKLKFDIASKGLNIFIQILQSYSNVNLSEIDKFGILSAIQEIDKQSIDYFENQLKGII